MHSLGPVLDCDPHFGPGRVFVCEDLTDDHMSALCGAAAGALIVTDRIKHSDIHGEFIVE